MDGVTVLQTIPQYEGTWGWNWLLLFPIVILCCVIGVAIWGIIDREIGMIIACVGLAFVLLAITLMAASNAKQVHTHDHYQVIISDSVSISEFTEKYNVLEQQGITFIVEEKAIG